MFGTKMKVVAGVVAEAAECRVAISTNPAEERATNSHTSTTADRVLRRVRCSLVRSLSVIVVGAVLAVGVLVGLAQPAAASLGDSDTTLRMSWNHVSYGTRLNALVDVYDESDSCNVFRDCDPPLGSVALYDNGQYAGSHAVHSVRHDQSFVEFDVGYLAPVGGHQFEAIYSGNFDSSRSNLVNVTVNRRECTVVVKQNSWQSAPGDAVQFYAYFTDGGIGSRRLVHFYDQSGTLLGSASAYDRETFVLWTSTLPVGATSVYAVTEGDHNHNRCMSNTVTHSVVRPNTAPVANDDVAIASPGQSVTIDVLANDVDNDLLTVTVERPPGSGRASVGDDGSIMYTPNAGFYGQDAFDYRITDPAGLSDVGTVTVDVDCMVRNDDSYTVAYNRPLVVVDPGVLVNDSYICGGPPAVWVDNQPQHGTVQLQPSGGFTYTPADGFLGSDLFTYRFEGLYSSGPAIVVLSVENSAPAAADQSVTAVSGAATPITLTAADPDGEPLTFAVGPHVPLHGTLTGTPPNLMYTAVAGYAGGDAFMFTVADSQGNRDEGTVTITVVAANDPPIAADIAVTVVEDTSAPMTLSAEDPDGDPLSFAVTGRPSHGSLTGTAPDLIYTPASDYEGPDSFEFTVDDGRGGTDAGTITITVTPAAPVATRVTAEGGTRVITLRGITFENLHARLTRADTKAPVGGQRIAFTVSGIVVCTAITAANGDAVCSGGLLPLSRLVTSGRYTASYAGDGDDLLAASGSAPLSTRIRLL